MIVLRLVNKSNFNYNFFTIALRTIQRGNKTHFRKIKKRYSEI